MVNNSATNINLLISFVYSESKILNNQIVNLVSKMWNTIKCENIYFYTLKNNNTIFLWLKKFIFFSRV